MNARVILFLFFEFINVLFILVKKVNSIFYYVRLNYYLYF